MADDPATPPAEPARRGVLPVAAIGAVMLLLTGTCSLASGLALYFSETPEGLDPISAIAVLRSGTRVAGIETGGMISVENQNAGLVVRDMIFDRQGEIAVIDSAGVVTVDLQPRGLVGADGVLTWGDEIRWRIADDGTIRREGESEPWGKAVGYAGTRGDRRAVGAYLLFFAERE